MNTRFNPTCNGRLHLGHLYAILVNQQMAKATGGAFIVRFDDDQPYWRERIGQAAVDESKEGIREDLQWLGIEPDAWTSEAACREQNETFAADLVLPNVIPDPADRDALPHFCFGVYYPYVPYLTLVKVVQDHYEGIDTLIRGEDLATEYSLYCYFCQILKIPRPAFYHLPRLRQLVRNPINNWSAVELSDVSKTHGNHKIADLRTAGWSPKNLIEALAGCCLIDSHGPWTFENVAYSPLLDGFLL